MNVEKVDIIGFMAGKLEECDKWLEGKDNAIAELEEAEARYNEAKKNVEDYTDENIAQVVNYRNDIEQKLIALGVIEPKVVEEAVEEAPVAEEVVAEEQVVVSPVVVM